MNLSRNYKISKDEELLHWVKSGDLEAFNTLFFRYADPLTNYIHQKIDDLEESKDIVQDIFVNLWANRTDLTDIHSTTHYLYRIATNRSLNIFKHQKVKDKYIKSFAYYIEQVERQSITPVELTDKDELVQQALLFLPEKMRTIFELRYFSGKSNQEVATILGISAHTVATQMKRALKIIRQQLPPASLLLFLLYF